MTDLIVGSLPQHYGHDQSRYSRIYVHHSASGKIYRSHLLQETASPDPVRHREIGQDDPHDYEYYVPGELDPLGERSENQCRSDDCKHALEHGEQEFRDISCRDGVQCDAVHESLSETSDKESQRMSFLGKSRIEHPGIADGHPQDAHYSHQKDGLHDDAQDVFLSDQAAVKECDAGDAHQKDKHGGSQYPGRIACIYHK